MGGSGQVSSGDSGANGESELDTFTKTRGLATLGVCRSYHPVAWVQCVAWAYKGVR